jgi:hypothetical protein
MPSYERAQLRAGGTIEFETSNPAGFGGMKQVFFEKGRHRVVAFFHDANVDVRREERLEKVIGEFNPTFPGKPNADYWRELFCWPTDLAEHPDRGLGIVLPTYPELFFFREGPLKGKEKSGSWFNNRDRRTGRAFRHVHVHASERGDLRGMALAMETVSRAVGRMHNAGLAHSDLSENNVLVDPIAGRALIIDVDSLVVTGLYPPDVLGTPGYIAPEVLRTKHLRSDDPGRVHPSAETDKHALAVMIYRHLLERHPLEGGRVFAGCSAEQEDELVYGSEALYSEHPDDERNRPVHGDYMSASILGPDLAELFRRAFVDGLRNPRCRPSAGEWAHSLARAGDNMVRCSNQACTQGWYVHHGESGVVCPYCGAARHELVMTLEFEREDKPGWFRRVGSVALNASEDEPEGTAIRRYHFDRQAIRGPGESTASVARVHWRKAPHAGLYLENIDLPNMGVRSERLARGIHVLPIARGQKVLLQPDLEIRLNAGDAPVRAWVRQHGS